MDIPSDLQEKATDLVDRLFRFGKHLKAKVVLDPDRLIAEALMAERDRCAACCHTALGDDFVMTGPAGIARQIENAIRQAP